MTQTGLITNPWVFNARVQPNARLRLFCFPYAGGGASIYCPWIKAFAPAIEVYPVQLPGRENRLAQRPFSQFSELVQALADALRPLLIPPFAFFGHSMGALLSFGLTHRLWLQQDPLPAHLFLSAYHAPQLSNDESLHALSDSALVRKMLELNGTQREVLANPELRKILLPLMRADFSVCESYTHTASTPLDCPITVFGGLQDGRAGRGVLDGWREQTSQPFHLHMLPGDHFFWRTNPQPLWQLLAQELQNSISLKAG